MHGDVETVTADTPAAAAAETMLVQRLGCLPVVDGRHHIVGIVTKADLVRLARDLLAAAPASAPRARQRRAGGRGPRG
jgi:CBS-domain-containing membrane protein